MNISYAVRSKFTPLCQEGIAAQQEALNAKRTIQVALASGGYSGKIKVSIEAGNLTEFEADWDASDPTRFPARIKAAATALRDCACWGSFDISHADGSLSIGKTE